MPIFDTQGTYLAQPPGGYAGLVAESPGVIDITSRRIINAQVAFGLAVGRGAADGTARLGGTGFEGIVVADKTRLNDFYAIDEFAAIIRKGVVWVTASVAVTPADSVFFVAATGAITNVASGNVAIANGRFEASAGVGALVPLYLA